MRNLIRKICLILGLTGLGLSISVGLYPYMVKGSFLAFFSGAILISSLSSPLAILSIILLVVANILDSKKKLKSNNKEQNKGAVK